METPIRMETIAAMAGLGPVIQNLGWANGWNETPPIVENCMAKQHQLEGREIGNCAVERKCPICLYSYKVDSSG